MPFMNFKIVNAKNISMELKKTTKKKSYLFNEVLIISCHIEI